MATYQTRCLDDADQIIKEHERKTKTTYSLLRSTKNFGCVDVPACTNSENEVRFETAGVPYCGVPFYVAGLKILQCQSSSRCKASKKRKPIKVEVPGEPDDSLENETEPGKFSVKKRRPVNSRSFPKATCTATVIMKEVIYYPKFQIHEHSKNVRLAVVRQLKEALKSRASVQKDRIIYVTVPSSSDHSGHTVTGITASTKPNARRLYVKNDFYGNNDANANKRAYYPVKKETCPPQPPPRLKVDQDDVEARSREVREVLQSIMALTYKPGTSEAFQELSRDLTQARVKYQQTLDSTSFTPSSAVTHPVVHTVQTSAAPTHQLVTVQAANTVPQGTITMATTSGQRTGIQLLNHTGLPGATVVALTTLPTANSQPNSNTVVVPQPSVSNADVTTTENSIFLEAMEAIFNPQM